MASSGFLASNNFFLSLIDKLEQKKNSYHYIRMAFLLFKHVCNITKRNSTEPWWSSYQLYAHIDRPLKLKLEPFIFFILSYNLHSRTQDKYKDLT